MYTICRKKKKLGNFYYDFMFYRCYLQIHFKKIGVSNKNYFYHYILIYTILVLIFIT